SVIKKFLEDPDPSIRRAAIQWAAEEGLVGLSAEIAAAAARSPVTLDVFEAYIGALEFLTPTAGGQRDAGIVEKHLAALLAGGAHPAALRSYALRMLRPDHPLLSVATLRGWADREDGPLRLEAVRALATSLLEPAQETLRTIAADREAPL